MRNGEAECRNVVLVCYADPRTRYVGLTNRCLKCDKMQMTIRQDGCVSRSNQWRSKERQSQTAPNILRLARSLSMSLRNSGVEMVGIRLVELGTASASLTSVSPPALGIHRWIRGAPRA